MVGNVPQVDAAPHAVMAAELPHAVDAETAALKAWAEQHLERCKKTTEADTCLVIKTAVAGFLRLGVRSKQVVAHMRSAGFVLDKFTSGGKKRACLFTFEGDAEARYVKLLADADDDEDE